MPQTIQDYLVRVRQGDTSIVRTVETFLANIQKVQSHHIFIETFEQEALDQAKALDQKIASGQDVGTLAGVVISIKDIILYKGHKASAASHMLADHTAIYNATVVQSLIDQDAIIIGRVNCDEFAMGGSNENTIYGATKNPLNTAKVCGGSSGGSAAAVAADCCHVSVGTDTGGSVRQPAAYCGTVGFKPTYGVHSRYGVMAFASSFDQVGILCHHASDIPLIESALAQPDANDSTSLSQKVEFNTPLSSKKVGVFKAVLDAEYDVDTKVVFEQRLDQLKNEGYEIVEFDFPYLDALVPCYYTLTTAEASSNLSRYSGLLYGNSDREAQGIEQVIASSRSQGFGSEVKRRILLGTFVLSSGYYDAYFEQAQKVRQLLVKHAEECLSQVELIVMPTTPSPAFDLGIERTNPVDLYMEDIFTVYANLIGAPAISIPMGTHPKENLPLGFQLIGKRTDDGKVIHTATALQSLFN